MKKVLLDMLICPACLPDETRLISDVIQEDGEDIVTGSLTCHQCKRIYPIRNGIAFLDPLSIQEKEKADSRYETAPVLSSYLWSHYGDILNGSNASAAYKEWADLMRQCSGVTIDAGSAVGRFTFEMSRKSDFTIGVDNSVSFIQAARELMINRRMEITLKQEGLLTRKETISLPETWNSEKVEFIVGDAQALPFRTKTFSSLASLNLVDKVPLPLKHLKEMCRVAKERDAQFLFSDPFSWSTDVADEKDWLGGTDSGPYSGRGIDNIIALLKGGENGFAPECKIVKHGHVWWKIRTHSNHFELIRSCFVKADR
ncbi:MAG: methyltransferase domain-containing protein [Deltaproteobacteria bacterium]|nr:methyltransferase domain-containing protein [Deltaproteobacteria bacterium]